MRSLQIYPDKVEAFLHMSDQCVGMIIKAMILYQEERKEPEFDDPTAFSFWCFYRQMIDTTLKKAAAGHAGGRASRDAERGKRAEASTADAAPQPSACATADATTQPSTCATADATTQPSARAAADATTQPSAPRSVNPSHPGYSHSAGNHSSYDRPRAPKQVLEQMYHQREITEEIDTADHLMESWFKEHPEATG